MKNYSTGLCVVGSVLFALIISSAVPAVARQKNGTAAVKPAFRLVASKRLPQTFSLKAAEAPLPEIAAEVARLLKTRVTMSPLMSRQRVTIEFSGLTTEAALRMLAPQVYIDYELAGDHSGQPRILAVYLHALNEPPPSSAATVTSNMETMLIEGDTEEDTREQKDSSLEVSYLKNKLTVHAKRQPLSIVLFKIAAEVGVPFDLHHESGEVVDVNFTNYTLEQAMRSLSSPSVRFYFRADLQTFETQPLRIALVSPGSKT